MRELSVIRYPLALGRMADVCLHYYYTTSADKDGPHNTGEHLGGARERFLLSLISPETIWRKKAAADQTLPRPTLLSEGEGVKRMFVGYTVEN